MPWVPTPIAFQAGACTVTGWKSAPGFVTACFLPYGLRNKCCALFAYCLKEYLWVCFGLSYLDKLQAVPLALYAVMTQIFREKCLVFFLIQGSRSQMRCCSFVAIDVHWKVEIRSCLRVFLWLPVTQYMQNLGPGPRKR